jgi:hypothetical protein
MFGSWLNSEEPTLNLQLGFALHVEPLAQTTKVVGLYQCEVGFADAF